MALNPASRGGQLNLLRTFGSSTPAPSTDESDAPRRQRPPAGRTEPVRSAGGLFRQEAIPRPTVAPTTPAEQAVASAYQVFDRYLEEGRRFAEGQSAWYSDEATQPDVTRDAIRAFAELLGILGRIGQQLGISGPIPNLPQAWQSLARPFHPQQDPSYGQTPTGEWLPADLSGATTAPPEPPPQRGPLYGAQPVRQEFAPDEYEFTPPIRGVQPGGGAPVRDVGRVQGAPDLTRLAQEKPTSVETNRWTGAPGRVR